MENHEHYQQAYKQGQKAYAKFKAQGRSGHLPSLEGLIKDIEIVSTVQLGVVEIPLKKVIGSYSNSRRIAFAKNFMPLSDSAEFKGKWEAVCAAHLNEGLRDPVKVYEYMNWFYVMEGNKRVSVLKYFNAYSVMAQVTRLIPKRDPEDEDVEKYYAFLELNRITGLQDFWFSKASRFYRFINLLDQYNPKLDLFSDKYKHFDSFVYQPFRKLYKQAGGDALSDTTADAYLEYARVYGIEEKLNEETQLEPIRHLVEELSARAISPRNIISEDFEEPVKSDFLSSFASLFKAKKKLKVGFVHARTPETSGWTLAHDLGRKELQEAMSDDVETFAVYGIKDNDEAYSTICNMIEEGSQVIFTTSAIFRRQTLRAALEHPEILFFNCSESKPYLHMSNYYGKTYEPKYLLGLLAGISTSSNAIGYLATESNAENLASLNAFAIGVKTVNPYAKVYVAYTESWNSEQRNLNAEQPFDSFGVDIIANKVLMSTGAELELLAKRGVYAYLAQKDAHFEEGWRPLGAGYWNWGVYYQRIVSSIASQSYEEVIRNLAPGSRLINFYWGMSTGVLDIWLSKTLPNQTHRLITQMRKLLVNDELNPFEGPLVTAEGLVVCEEEQSLDTEQILSMNWLNDNIVVTGGKAID